MNQTHTHNPDAPIPGVDDEGSQQDPTVRSAARLLSDLVARAGERDIGSVWKQVQVTLRKAPVDQMRIARIVAERNTDALARIIGDLAAGRTHDTLPKPEPRGGPGGRATSGIAAAAAAGAEAASDAPAPATPPMAVRARTVPTEPELKAALAAFKKRIKLTRLDQESRLGGNRPTTGGKKFDEIAILPPNQYGKAVWDELVKRNKIKDTGGGFYTMVEGAAAKKAEGEGGAAGGEE